MSARPRCPQTGKCLPLTGCQSDTAPESPETRRPLHTRGSGRNGDPERGARGPPARHRLAAVCLPAAGLHVRGVLPRMLGGVHSGRAVQRRPDSARHVSGPDLQQPPGHSGQCRRTASLPGPCLFPLCLQVGRAGRTLKDAAFPRAALRCPAVPVLHPRGRAGAVSVPCALSHRRTFVRGRGPVWTEQAASEPRSRGGRVTSTDWVLIGTSATSFLGTLSPVWQVVTCKSWKVISRSGAWKMNS